VFVPGATEPPDPSQVRDSRAYLDDVANDWDWLRAGVFSDAGAIETSPVTARLTPRLIACATRCPLAQAPFV
jgi:hypothetical protein